MAPVSRRQFLAGSAGFVLAACGKSKPKADVTVKKQKEAQQLNVVLGVDQNSAAVAGIEERIPFLVFKGETPSVDLPAEVGFAAGASGGSYGEGQQAEAHKDGIPTRPYYVIRHKFETPGVYRMGVNIGGGSTETALQVVDPSSVKMPIPGRALPATIKTPTTTDPQGVNPICTRSPVCPWHDVSLDAGLTEKRPLVLYVGTPARCQTKTCGPVLNVLLDVAPAFQPKVRFIHLEVYKSLTSDETIPALDELGLQSEPWIFFVGADGVVRERIGGPVDRVEARDALTRLTA